jgi:hypothetical protein
MVALGIEGGREREHVRGTKLHAKPASLAALNNDRNTSFCHENPPLRSNQSLRMFQLQDVIMRCNGAGTV